MEHRPDAADREGARGKGAGGCPGSSRSDSGDCCDDDTGTAKKICMKACGYYMEDLGVTEPSNGDFWPQFGMNDWQPPVIDPSCMGRARIHGYASTQTHTTTPAANFQSPATTGRTTATPTSRSCAARRAT